jgi:hypothetical protein
MPLSGVKFLVAILTNILLWHQCRAGCSYGFAPGNGNTCNVPPGDTSYFEAIVVVAEDNAGDCQSTVTNLLNEVYQTAGIQYTGEGKLQHLPLWIS